MAGGEDDVLHAPALRHLRPFGGIKLLRFELLGERAVGDRVHLRLVEIPLALGGNGVASPVDEKTVLGIAEPVGTIGRIRGAEHGGKNHRGGKHLQLHDFVPLRQREYATNTRPTIVMTSEIVCEIENGPTCARGSPRSISMPKRMTA